MILFALYNENYIFLESKLTFMHFTFQRYKYYYY